MSACIKSLVKYSAYSVRAIIGALGQKIVHFHSIFGYSIYVPFTLTFDFTYRLYSPLLWTDVRFQLMKSNAIRDECSVLPVSEASYSLIK